MSRRTWIAGPLLLCAGLLLGLAGCSGKTKTGENGENSGTKGEAVKFEGPTYPVGVVVELSGGLQDWGIGSRRGMELAQEHLAGQDGITLELDFRDNASKPDQSSSEFVNLVTVKKVLTVLGAVASSHTRAMKEQANKYKVPLITHASTNVQLTKDTDWLFRTCFNDDFQGEVCAKYAVKNLSAKKAIVVTDAAQDYSRGLSASFIRTFKAAGGTIVEELTYQKDDKIFTSQVGKLQAADIDCVFASGYAPEVGLLLKTAREAGFDKPFLGGDGLSMEQFFKIAGPHVAGVFMCDHAHAADQDPDVQKFVNAFKAKFEGKLPDSMAFLGYDAVFALHDAIKRAKAKGEVTRESVRDALGAIKDLKLVTGTITMGEDHEVKKRAVVLEYQADGSTAFKDAVEP